MPRIQMTRTVKLALVFLRVYLIILLGLIVVKFVLLFSEKPTGGEAPLSTPSSSQSH